MSDGNEHVSYLGSPVGELPLLFLPSDYTVLIFIANKPLTPSIKGNSLLCVVFFPRETLPVVVVGVYNNNYDILHKLKITDDYIKCHFGLLPHMSPSY